MLAFTSSATNRSMFVSTFAFRSSKRRSAIHSSSLCVVKTPMFSPCSSSKSGKLSDSSGRWRRTSSTDWYTCSSSWASENFGPKDTLMVRFYPPARTKRGVSALNTRTSSRGVTGIEPVTSPTRRENNTTILNARQIGKKLRDQKLITSGSYTIIDAMWGPLELPHAGPGS